MNKKIFYKKVSEYQFKEATPNELKFFIEFVMNNENQKMLKMVNIPL